MITRSDIERLATQTTVEAPVVSLYLSIDKSRTDDDHMIRLKNLMRDAENGLDGRLTHDQREQVKMDLDEIQNRMKQDGSTYTHGVAIFASGREEMYEVHSVPTTIESQIAVDFRPNVTPLIGVLEDIEPFATCMISRDHARIFLGRLLDFNEIAELDDDMVPGQHDQGGWSQARYERHIEDHVHKHFKTVGDELFQRMEQRGFHSLILSGPDEVVADFKEHLHPYLQQRIIGQFHLNMDSTSKQVYEESLNVIRQWKDRRDEEAIEMVRGATLAHNRGVSGLPDTLAALQQGQVQQLVVDNQIHTPGARCTQCEALQSTAPAVSECQYCGGELEQLDDLIPAIINAAFLQRAEVVILNELERRDQMADLGGIGAVLRYRIDE